jgi:hypothetical protein
MSEDLLSDPSGLAARLPRFPSPDWQSARDFGPNEELLWRTLVEAGQGAEHGNSFVVVGAPEGSAQDLWPADRRAAFYTTERRPGRATQTRVVAGDTGQLAIERTILGERRDQSGPTHRLTSGPVLPGRPLVDEIAQGTPSFARETLTRWRAMVEASAADPDGVAIDLVPHNLLVDEDGGLTYIDDEWRSTEWTADFVVARGLIWLCERLSTVPTVWQSRPSRRALLTELADLIGFPPLSDWEAAALRREAELQVELLRKGRGQEGFEAEVAHTETELARLLELPMSPLRPKLGPLIAERDDARRLLAVARGEIDGLASELGEVRHDVVRTHAALATAHEELRSIHQSRVFRVLLGAHDRLDRLAPTGSRRRWFYGRVRNSLRRTRRS